MYVINIYNQLSTYSRVSSKIISFAHDFRNFKYIPKLNAKLFFHFLQENKL